VLGGLIHEYELVLNWIRGFRAHQGRASATPAARIFWEETLVIVSVTSWGDAICRVNDMTQPTEIASVLDFLTEFGVAPA
jgi:hypothetical protein